MAKESESRWIARAASLPPSQSELVLLDRISGSTNNSRKVISFDLGESQILEIRKEGAVERFKIDEEVLAYFVLQNKRLFKKRRVLEVGANFGIGGLTAAIATEAKAVEIRVDVPQMVDVVRSNVDVNKVFFPTPVLREI